MNSVEIPMAAEVVSERPPEIEGESPDAGEKKPWYKWRPNKWMKWVLRLFDWSSDFALLVAFIIVFQTIPSMGVRILKPDSDATYDDLAVLGTKLTYEDNSRLCISLMAFETRQPCLENPNADHDFDISYSEFKANIINSCSNDTFEVSAAVPKCCDVSDLPKSTLDDLTMVASCYEYGSNLIEPQVILQGETPWFCAQESLYLYQCDITDSVILNTLALFAFVVISKEVCVIINSKFCVQMLDTEDLMVLSSDSCYLLIVFLLRNFNYMNFPTAHLKISDNVIFFWTWIALDFLEKIVSASLAYLIITYTLNPLALFALITTTIGFLTSLNFWWDRLREVYIRKRFSMEKIPDEDPNVVAEKKKLLKIAQGIPEEEAHEDPAYPFRSIDHSKLDPVKSCYLRMLYPFIRLWKLQSVIRGILIIIVFINWIAIQNVNDVEDDDQLKVNLKLLGGVYCAFVLAEFSLNSSKYAVAKEKINRDIVEAYMDLTARNRMMRESIEHYAMLRNIRKGVSRKARWKISLSQGTRLFEIVVLAFQIGFALWLTSLSWEATCSHGESHDISGDACDVHVCEGDECYTKRTSAGEEADGYHTVNNTSNLVMVYIAVSALGLLWSVMLFFFQHIPCCKGALQLCCCIGGLDRVNPRKEVAAAFKTSISHILDPRLVLTVEMADQKMTKAPSDISGVHVLNTNPVFLEASPASPASPSSSAYHYDSSE